MYTPPSARLRMSVFARLRPGRRMGAVGLAVGGVAAWSLMPAKEEETALGYTKDKDFTGKPLKRMIQRFDSMVDRGQDPQRLRSRSEMVKALKSGEEFDVVIVGAGCTGAGAALDAQARRAGRATPSLSPGHY